MDRETVCSIEGCVKPLHSMKLSLCNTHYKAQWRANNKEKYNNTIAEWRANNVNIIKEKAEAWRAANPNYQREYDIKNSIKVKEYRKSWKQNNKDKVRDAKRRRRAALYNAPYDNWTEADVLQRDNYTCQLCFKPINKDLHIDHIKALWAGGTNLLNNVRATHGKCNNSRTKEQEEKGI